MNERRKSGIYIIKNTLNGKCYIGQAKSIGDRWYTHKSSLSRGKHHSRYLQASWNKYGQDAFVFQVLEYVKLDKELLTQKEQYWINKLKPAYNLAPAAGSSLGIKHPPRTEEFKERMRIRKLGFKHSKETIELLKQNAIDFPYFHTPEAKQKISNALKGKIKSPETIAKHRAKMIGRKQSQEHILKRVAKLIGHSTSDYTKQRIAEANRKRLTGVKQSPETIAKRAASLKGRKRPDHAIQPMLKALAEKRKPTLDKIRAALVANINLNITHLATELNCARSTIRKIKKELQCQLQQQKDSASAAQNLQKNKGRSFK